jgi:CHAD domain-containing protein
VKDALDVQQQHLVARTARLGGATAEDVHQGRVAARRLRSLLKTFRPLLDARRRRSYRNDLRSYARALAEVRESDVRRDLLVPLSRRDSGMSPSEFHRLSVQLESACHAARDALRRRLAEPSWAALSRALERHASSERLMRRHDAGLAEVLSLVDRSWRKPRRLLEAGPRDMEELHELRLALKHCRYALEAVASVEPETSDRLMRRLRAAQDRIGEHRDFVQARHWVEANELALGAILVRRLVRLIDRRMEVLHEQALERSERVLPAYQRWCRACRKLRRAGTRDRR